MNVTQATDDFLMALQIEKNDSPNTIQNYANDLSVFNAFLIQYNRSTDLHDLPSFTVRRFIQHQVLHHGARPTMIQRRISFLKSFRHYCQQENVIEWNFMAGYPSPKS